MNRFTRFILLLSLAAIATPVLAGTLNNAGSPPDGSGMPTTTEIYNRLDSGAAIAAPGVFKEPAVGPTVGTGKTLAEIGAKLPAPDNTNGLKANEAPSGKTFWGLNKDGGAWGAQTGSNASVLDTTEATVPALAANISIGKKAFVNGALVTGTLYGGYTCTGTMNGTRWCDNGNGTVRDMTTGLIWLNDASWGGTYPWWANAANTTTVFDRVSAVRNGNPVSLSDGSAAGDWRMPTKAELVALTTGTEAVLSGTPRAFTSVQGNLYWSSSSLDSNFAWVVSVYNGNVGSVFRLNLHYVWPVRSGQ